jgi:hypothetical protein
MRNDPSAEELIFLVRAWKAAFAKAQIARLALTDRSLIPVCMNFEH